MLDKCGGDINVAVASMWKSMSAEERAVYQEQSSAIKAARSTGGELSEGATAPSSQALTEALPAREGAAAVDAALPPLAQEGMVAEQGVQADAVQDAVNVNADGGAVVQDEMRDGGAAGVPSIAVDDVGGVGAAEVAVPQPPAPGADDALAAASDAAHAAAQEAV